MKTASSVGFAFTIITINIEIIGNPISLRDIDPYLIDGKIPSVSLWFSARRSFYCTFKDCSAMLLYDENEVVIMSECPISRRLLCAQCNVSWHAGIECEEFEKLGKVDRENEDIMVMELARQTKRRTCPTCNFYVEKISRCLHIICRLRAVPQRH
ncbi:hypothetical protein FNV43_RR08060 [Rhamnella rubrinervis]|uniref:IBR domain-containing protein n=1 Tax=Rhamnella rubrinervis TaxID=2594499 RepID=A0A8K0HHS0_9ROSA|nr:hypothetical protein FNV43_RR08060 [Rhamnella rubrinervis]